MAPRPPGGLEVAPTATDRYHTVVVVGIGTPGARGIVRINQSFGGYGILNEVLGDLFYDWNNERQSLVKLVPYGPLRYSPINSIPTMPHGFLDKPENAEKTRNHWEPFIEHSFREMRRASDTRGMSGGCVIYLLTGAGGHLPVAHAAVKMGREWFPDALHLGFYFLPWDDRALWMNLRQYDGYPDDLGIPIVIADNRNRTTIDQAVPALLATLVSGQRHTDRGQHTFTESFAHLSGRNPVMAMSYACAELPIVPLSLTDRLRGYRPGVAEQAVAPAVAKLLTEVLQPSATLIDCAEPETDEIQFIGLGGMPTARHSNRWLEIREEFKKQVKRLASDSLSLSGQSLPTGLSITWSNSVMVTPQRFIRIPATRVFPLTGQTARDYIDAMLATESKPRLLPAGHR